jgi:hypothetical protein
LKKQTSLGIFGTVFGWCDTTEEQARFTLHSHILLFIALFDALITLLWSNCKKVREDAQKELVEYLKKTMSSSYDLVEEDFIHETPLLASNIQDSDNNFLKKTMNSTYDLVEEYFIHETPISTSKIQDDDNNFLKKIMTSSCDLVEEDLNHKTLLSTSNIQDDDVNFQKKHEFNI